MVRIDKYLWAIRVYKTRSEAAAACKGGRVEVNGVEAKPAREVREGDVLSVRKTAVRYTYKILQLVENRQPAKNVALYVEDQTPDEELLKRDTKLSAGTMQRERGAGRPTKKDRRELDRLRKLQDY
ncbi:MAG: RNA-binding S4 domain-containing protein [Prevotellaceae bacterium]|jgi:ribosome-associated heat shock protein Hsp15|nr:RNA-binding S4 domain-containing protein [Prevotellaceae bacterium]